MRPGRSLIPPRRRLMLAVVAAAVALAAAACSSSTPPPPGSSPASSSPGSGTPAAGGTATVAETSGDQPNYIWPFTPATNYSVFNAELFQWLMYRPLYMFGDNGPSVAVNYALSPADAPVYSDGGKTVTITMKGWKWSDGETVDAADVAFWINMEKAEKANYAGYTPGTFPDDLASYSITSPDVIVLHLTKGYSSTWFTYNELAEITPMPLAWDVTSAGAAAGSGGCNTSTAKCAAVYNYLSAQAKNEAGYTTSPLWAVVDGPWKLSSFSPTGNDTLVANKSYSGSPKPKLSAVQIVSFTSPTAEFTALKSGSVDVSEPTIGLPEADLPQKPANSAVPPASLLPGYTFMPQYLFQINYYQPNFKNPTVGPMFSQLYFRQALQELIDQQGISTAVFHGYAVPGTGTVPAYPPSAWIPAIQNENGGDGPYPFSVSGATALLTSHGWKMVGGVMTCEDPAKCGAGVKQGQQAAFSLYYSTNSSVIPLQAEAFKSDASKAGVDVTIVGKTFNTIISQDVPANYQSWDMSGYGGWLYNGPGFLPSGEPLYETGAGSNVGQYSDPTMNSLITAAQTPSGGTAAFASFATYAAQQLPYLYTPDNYRVQAVKSTLQGVAFNPLGTLLPEYWSFTK
jgi:peptide/nickel transport system substrate-binding protein